MEDYVDSLRKNKSIFKYDPKTFNVNMGKFIREKYGINMRNLSYDKIVYMKNHCVICAQVIDGYEEFKNSQRCLVIICDLCVSCVTVHNKIMLCVDQHMGYYFLANGYSYYPHTFKGGHYCTNDSNQSKNEVEFPPLQEFISDVIKQTHRFIARFNMETIKIFLMAKQNHISELNMLIRDVIIHILTILC